MSNIAFLIIGAGLRARHWPKLYNGLFMHKAHGFTELDSEETFGAILKTLPLT